MTDATSKFPPNTCLHCKLLSTIEAHFRENGDVTPEGDVVINIHEAIEGMGEVMAEFLASNGNRHQWDRMTKEIQRAIREAIPVKRAQGAFPDQLKAH